MELIVLSSSGELSSGASEPEIVNALFEKGLENFHLRKPQYSVTQLREWLSKIEPKYLERISLHTFHDLIFEFQVGGIHTSEKKRDKSTQSCHQDSFLLNEFPQLRFTSSFHDLGQLRFAPKTYNYIFISPIFDSISRPHYKCPFTREEIKEAVDLSRNKVFALGGVNAGNLKDVQQLGFDGAGVLGAIWNAKDPLKAYAECKEVADGLPSLSVKLTYPEQQQQNQAFA